MTGAHDGLRLLPGPNGRESRDRLEILTALINGPGFDPLLRADVIEVPPEHVVFGWRCRVPQCQRSAHGTGDLCDTHRQQWSALGGDEADRAEFFRTATPLLLTTAARTGPCRVTGCERMALGHKNRFCPRHDNRWRRATARARAHGVEFDLDEWLADETPYPGFGVCIAASCRDGALSPLGLCPNHDQRYTRDGRPGGAELEPRKYWAYAYDRDPSSVTVRCDLVQVFRQWCAQVDPVLRVGEINLLGLHPLVKAEFQWALFARLQHTVHTRWPPIAVQSLVNSCRTLETLTDLDLDGLPRRSRGLAQVMLQSLRVVYVTPSETREAGYLELDHFGTSIRGLYSHYDLTGISQRWLRGLLWDHLAHQLRTPGSPRTKGPYDDVRRSCLELSTFLEIGAEDGGHDPRLLRAEHVHRFLADQRHRARNGLPSLVVRLQSGKPSTVTETTLHFVFSHARKFMRWALESGEADRICLPREFVTAFPPMGTGRHRTRSPFTDEVARALADENNLRRFAATHDPGDRGLRDIWETIIVTGRRASEVIKLRLDCTGRYNKLPMLWHDQTKVGNYDQAIRIPEYTFQRIKERQRTTLARFEGRFGRPATAPERARMSLFPASKHNPGFERSVSYAWYGAAFHDWVSDLDLGSCVTHQARHTLATKLLANGAGLHHIKRFLGHISNRMAEHYAKVAVSEIEDVLQHVWVAGPGTARPGEVLSSGTTPLDRHQAEALALDLTRRSTPAEGGFCTFQPVVDGAACPWNLNCHSCDKFVMSGADLLYWRRKREQWMSIAERAPDDSTADYLHQVFEPTARAIDGLEKALGGLGLLEDALALDLRRPQDYFHRVWSTAFRAADLADAGQDEGEYSDTCTADDDPERDVA
ncbi:tyrosine-type recombinase/integrase [Streptomyces griseoruber]|uniref:tyrosine-type recombinase/integrase n=1 Tax=Streptomyces griseoruber TaxID=1943 RepID=UPI0006E1AE5B|nr:site-specific integrase [Streptomyces griseoruber]